MIKNNYITNDRHLRKIGQRETDLVSMYASGKTFKDLSERFGITKERCRQIFFKCLRTIGDIYNEDCNVFIERGIMDEQFNIKINKPYRPSIKCYIGSRFSVYKSDDGKSFVLKKINKPMPFIEPTKKPNDKVLNMNIESLYLSVRTCNALKNTDVQTLRDLIEKNPSYLLRAPNFGRKSLNEVENVLSSFGLSLKKGENE